MEIPTPQIDDLIMILPYRPKSRERTKISDLSLTLQAGVDEIPYEEGDEETTPPVEPHRSISASLSISGILPTASEVKTAIENAYSSLTPHIGDVVYMTQFHYLVVPDTRPGGASVSENDIFRVSFSVSGNSFMAFQIGPSRLL